MVFSSFTFLIYFLPAVLLIYYMVPRNSSVKNYVLLLFSLIFYSWGEPKYVFLMIISVIAAYLFGIYISRHKTKAVLILAVIFNIGLLIFFKAAFSAGILPLPIGISFYTFQVLSYIIDVYRGDVKPQKNPFALGTYITLFPQLIAGPIVRYQTVAEQINQRKESLEKFSDGVIRFSIGLAKKIILANLTGRLFTEILELFEKTGEISVCSAWIGAFFYTFQIYFDFSGYSDMAIGLGRMFGFDFLENFNYPYISKSITEFWRRWHISLSSWFKDYVYIPLGGNKKGVKRQYINLAIVWGLTGLWHGFSWNFLAWGMFYYVLLVFEKAFFLEKLKKMPAVLSHAYTMFMVIISWVLFAIPDARTLLNYIKTMFGFGNAPVINDRTMFYISNYLGIFVIAALACTPVFKKVGELIAAKSKNVYGNVVLPIIIFALLLFSAAFLAGDSFNPFLYFRF